MADLLPIGAGDLVPILALNNAHASELSWLEPAELKHLVGQAFLARRVGAADALLLAFDQDADYDGENISWFRQRYPRFVYIDRVVVADHARGRGLARALYETLFEKARDDGHRVVTCEVNLDPPNPASDAFHEALDFAPVGAARIAAGKTVRYFVRPLA